MYTRLFILVEGPDDNRFFDRVIKPHFAQFFSNIIIKEYAEQPQSFVNTLVSTCKGGNKNYIFHSDIDDNTKSVKWKKEKLIEKYQQVEKDHIIVAITEIESWYLAGLDKKSSKKLGIDYLNKTDEITKEDFESLIPSKFDSKIDFELEILKEFEMVTAKKKNRSLNFFITDFVSKFTQTLEN